MDNKEIEVRFLEIDKKSVIDKIIALGGKDCGETMLEEIIFRPKLGSWREERKFVRLRNDSRKNILSYKHRKENPENSLNDVDEIEIEVSDFNNTKLILEKMGLEAERFQQKLRHTLTIDDVVLDIDTWPQIPAYVEIESDKEEKIKEISNKLDLDWNKVIYKGAGTILEDYYKIPIRDLVYFTFDRIE